MARVDRKERRTRYQAAVDDPVKAVRLGTSTDGEPTYLLRFTQLARGSSCSTRVRTMNWSRSIASQP